MLHTYVNHHVGVFYHHFAPSLSSKVSLKCVFKLMNVAVTLTHKKTCCFGVLWSSLWRWKKNPVCSGVNLNCPRGAVVKKAFMFYLIVKGTKSISRIKIHGPFLFWLENSSIISWLCGSFLSISLSRGANKGKRPQRSPSYFFNTWSYLILWNI